MTLKYWELSRHTLVMFGKQRNLLACRKRQLLQKTKWHPQIEDEETLGVVNHSSSYLDRFKIFNET